MRISPEKMIETDRVSAVKLLGHPHVDKKYFGYHYRGERLRQVLQLSESSFLNIVRQWLNCLKNRILRLNQQKNDEPGGRQSA